jgi:hypothetical protein
LIQAVGAACPSMPSIEAFATQRYYPTTGTMYVYAASSCAWNISALPSFLTTSAPLSGLGSANFSYSVAANSGAARSGNIVLNAAGQSKLFPVTQEAAPLCSGGITLTPSSVSLPAAGASGTIGVSSAPGCTWSVATLPAWVTLPNGSSGTGNGSFNYVAAANTGASRYTYGSVTGPSVSSTFVVNQAATPCATWSISPSSVAFPVAGASGSINVTAATGCTWSLSGVPAWLSLTGAASGSGSGAIGYSIGANTGAARSATATLSGAGPSLPLGLSQASAQAASCVTRIGSGVPVSTRLQAGTCPTSSRGNTYYADRYVFDSAPGRAVTILLTSSAFDTYVYLRDPYNNVIKSDDDGGGGTNSRIPYGSGSFTLPAGTSGAYTIEVTSYGSYGTGNYTLSLTQ